MLSRTFISVSMSFLKSSAPLARASRALRTRAMMSSSRWSLTAGVAFPAGSVERFIATRPGELWLLGCPNRRKKGRRCRPIQSGHQQHEAESNSIALLVAQPHLCRS
ncbi:hypothetical protein KC351_g12 [Hortaea werneckii]|nr:hypothetical protein KC351_g12 [Hortaea werneckii]